MRVQSAASAWALGLGGLGRAREEVQRQAAALGLGTAGLATPERLGRDSRGPWSWGLWECLVPLWQAWK